VRYSFASGRRVVLLLTIVGLVAFAPTATAASAPRGGGQSAECAFYGTMMALGFLQQAQAKHQRVPVSKLRGGWPKMLDAAHAAERGLDRSSPAMRQLSTRFAAIVDELERAGDALRAGDLAGFWSAVGRTKRDAAAVWTLSKQAHVTCTSTSSDGRGKITIGG